MKLSVLLTGLLLAATASAAMAIDPSGGATTAINHLDPMQVARTAADYSSLNPWLGAIFIESLVLAALLVKDFLRDKVQSDIAKSLALLVENMNSRPCVYNHREEKGKSKLPPA